LLVNWIALVQDRFLNSEVKSEFWNLTMQVCSWELNLP